MSDYTYEYGSVAAQFDIQGDVVEILPWGEGHINVTMLVRTTVRRYIMQKINTRIFTDPVSLMRNICYVTEYLQSQGQETLEVVPLKGGESFLFGKDCFRMYLFIENTVTFQTVTDAKVFRASGKAFGEFQNYLAGFDASNLTETLTHFHDTPKRFGDFQAALRSDICGRANACREEINFLLERAGTYSLIAQGLKDGTLPLRVTHNDTKLNNILMDADTHEARAVIDLDTVMPGSMLYDFGDSIRFGASTAAEDEKDLDKVHFDLSLFEAYAQGFCGAVKNSITPAEAELLPYSAYLMTVECGMRFLTDYLSGDTYFATKYAEHNLVRCRTQLKLAGEMEQQSEKMKAVIKEILS